MKMTDESALAVLDSILMRISFPNNERAINNLPEHAAMRDHISARLAADQQKGGGEPVAVVIPNAVGVEVAWANPPSAGRPPVGTKLYTTPQPSIPAPAQQVVDEAKPE